MEKAGTYGLPAVLTPRDAARFLGLNPKTVYVALREQGIPHRRVGKRIIIMRDQLLSWLGKAEAA